MVREGSSQSRSFPGANPVAAPSGRTFDAELGMGHWSLREGLTASSASGAPFHAASARRLPKAAALAALAALVWAPAASAACVQPLSSRLIPLPVWATLPNEGNTWGFMPVILRVCPEDQRTESILAPSVTWNSVIHLTGTLRWFHYPSEDTTLTLIASASTRINYNLLFLWQRLPVAPGRWTDEVTLRLQRSAFFRFFGLGPATPASAETSYTGFHALGTARRGLVVAPHLNLGVVLGVERDGVQALGVPGLPLAPDVFPGTPGMGGATLLWQGLSARWDDRRGGDYAERGARVELTGAVVEGLAGSPTFLRGQLQASGIVRELPWLSGSGRLAWSAVSSRRAPFYQQSRLGGSFLLRGFTQDRFIDQQAWTVDLEQRIRVLQTHFFGVTTDWRVDPFVSAGQVFSRLGDAFSRPRVAVGLGLRAFVHPNVVGRIDLSDGGEGVKVYVEIGYPY